MKKAGIPFFLLHLPLISNFKKVIEDTYIATDLEGKEFSVITSKYASSDWMHIFRSIKAPLISRIEGGGVYKKLAHMYYSLDRVLVSNEYAFEVFATVIYDFWVRDFTIKFHYIDPFIDSVVYQTWFTASYSSDVNIELLFSAMGKKEETFIGILDLMTRYELEADDIEALLPYLTIQKFIEPKEVAKIYATLERMEEEYYTLYSVHRAILHIRQEDNEIRYLRTYRELVRHFYTLIDREIPNEAKRSPFEKTPTGIKQHPLI